MYLYTHFPEFVICRVRESTTVFMVTVRALMNRLILKAADAFKKQ